MQFKRVFLFFIVVVLLSSLGCVTDRGYSNYRPSSEPTSNSTGYSYYESAEPVVSEEDKQVTKAIEAADAYMARGEYSKAYQTLTEVNDNYPWRSELADALYVCEKKYADDVIRLAADAFETDQDYDAAIAELKYAQRDLPDNEAIVNEIAKYESYRPVGLETLSSFYDENAGLYYEDKAIKDYCGNTNYSWLKWGSKADDAKDSYTCYRLNRQFSRITGIIFINEDSKNLDFLGSISFYGDEKLLAGPFDMGKGCAPVNFDIDVDSTVELKIYLVVKDSYVPSSWDYYYYRPLFANVKLYPKIDQ